MEEKNTLHPDVARLLAFSAVGAVWLFAMAVGIRIGLDLGRAIF